DNHTRVLCRCRFTRVEMRNIKSKKGKRWSKGGSSSSNPESNRYRQQAKSRFFDTDNKGKGSLTTDALTKHDLIQNEETEKPGADEGERDVESVGGNTFNTFATNWTQCSNPCFNRLLKNWESNSELHKEMLAILAAITEVIKSKDGKETETEYFAALMTTLDTVDTIDSLAAVMSLLLLTIKRVSKDVLKAKFSDISKVFVELLGKYTESNNTTLIKSLIGCLAVLLRAQDLVIWSSSSTMQTFHGILCFVIYAKPKIRKAAQHAVCAILKGSDFIMSQNSSDHQLERVNNHPAGSSVAKFCIEQIEKNAGSKDYSTVMHILTLLKDVMHTFPQNYLKNSCETILKVMTLGTTVVKSCCLQALYGMFVSLPNHSSLSAQLNAQIINALYDFQPSVNDIQPLIAWLSVMKEAHLSLNRFDADLCLSHLPRFFSTSIHCLLSEKSEVFPILSDCLKILLTACVSPLAPKIGSDCEKALNIGNNNSVAHNLLKAMETGLKYQYHQAWAHVLQILAAFFQVLGKDCYKIMDKLLQSLADLRDSYRFSFSRDLDVAFGMAIRSMGPRNVLQFVNLHLDSSDMTFPRSWMIPVLRDNIMNTELSFFTSFFVPLAKQLNDTAEEKKKQQKMAEFKTLNILQSQIWSLLPGFCTHPTDLKDSFKGIARLLGSLLTERSDLRLVILNSLRSIIKSSADNEQDKAEVTKFAKNYLPILFNLYTNSSGIEKGSLEEGIRLAVYETVKVYMTVADSQLVESLFDKALSKEETDIDDFTRHAVMDLLRTMLPYVDKSRISKLYSVCIPHLTNTYRTVQKKVYRILEEICGCDSCGCHEFVINSIDLIQSTLSKSLSGTAPSSTAPRLRCLFHVIRKLDASNLDFISSVIPEVMLCTKHGSQKSKQAAFNLITQIGKTMITWKYKSSDDIMRDFIKLMLAGLAGSPQMVSSSILSLGTVLHAFKDELPDDVVELLIKNMCLLMTSQTREIVQSTLSFVKVLFSVLNEVKLAQHLDTLMEGLVNMTDDARKHFRIKVKEILDRLVRKFGFEIISKMAPVKFDKVLRNVRKVQSRKNRNKLLQDVLDDDDDTSSNIKNKMEDIDDILQDTDSEDEKVKSKKRSRESKLKNSTWIEESADKDIVDFLDPRASKSVSSTVPRKSTDKSRKDSDYFNIAPDGRFIISEDGDDRNKNNIFGEDIDELVDAMSGLA
ncbi:RRP12 (predicted), partial [Pycnogonum litorale]